MFVVNSVRVAPGLRSALAVACGVALSGAQGAWAAEDVGEAVVVTASRFEQSAQAMAANVTVITREDIRAMPGLSVPDVLRMAAGADVRAYYGGLGIDAAVDLRGFGATSASNSLIMVDGQRLNPIDMGGVIWSAIPKESIARIEVIRGSGSVLFGNGASGGVINIITDKSRKQTFSASASVGSFGYKDADVRLAAGGDLGDISLTVHHANEDGYRQNTQQSEDSLSGRAGLRLGAGRAFVDYTVYKDTAGLPGGLSQAKYEQSPRSAKTLEDKQERNGYRIRPGVSFQVNSQLAFEAEVALEHQDLKGDYVKSGMSSDRIRDTSSFSPRVRWQHGLGSLTSETVAGVDLYSGKLRSDNVGFATQGGGQSSSSLYAQNVTHLSPELSLTAGARVQRVRQEAWQDAFADYGTAAMTGSATNIRQAYDLGAAYATDNWRVYGKTGTTFRFANVDELFGYDPDTYSPVFAGNLRPQHGRINEVGGNLSSGAFKLSGSLYALDLTDEIGYDGAQFANLNLDPTRRVGLETEASWQVASSLTMKLAYSYLDAHVRSGAYEGNELPLVSRNKVSLQGIWNVGSLGTYSALVRTVGSRHYDGDYANTGGMLAGYTTLDLQAGWDFKPWRITAKVMNAFNRKYAPEAVKGSSAYAYWPADGRALYVSGQYAF
jgi:iron complex outermembrane receptor protein